MKNLENEIWKDILGYEGLYQVSSCGRIKCLPKRVNHWRGGTRLKPEKILKLISSSNGYLKVNLYKKGIMKTVSVHRLVLSNFIENIGCKPTVNHIDGNKTNNNLFNLEWASFSRNAKHAYEIGLNSPNLGSKHINAKINEDDVLFIRKSNMSNKDLAALFNITDSNITAIRKNKTWNHV